MGSLLCTPTPTQLNARITGGRTPDRTIDIGALIKHQEMTRDLPVPSLNPGQLRACKKALSVLRQKVNDSSGFGEIDQEYDALPAEELSDYRAPTEKTAAVLPNNRAKNRYRNVLPYNYTRVLLSKKHLGPTYTDYINASFVQDHAYNNLPLFIATQGPLSSTVSDFWAMVLQQRCPIIVMLTQIVDGDQNKCAHYFPRDENQTQTHGQITVTNRKTSLSQHGIVRRVFEVQDTKFTEPLLTMVHYEYLEWPDFSVPPSTRSVRELTRALSSIPPSAGPFVVHCSAGIGRTGTFCVIDHTLRRILGGDLEAVDIKSTVRNFRSQRDGMVQTRDQYQFCYQAVEKELEDYVRGQK
ncbi:protein-tyrosine-phosphatase PTP1 [Physcomitrium patens]|uniref:protein-tyrosine-phosphatase n=1 Tax=Physcomitrium patens TaxID=3218 RepID=A0A2K1KSZ5_PHYPA|nr:protein-tyrosine-phosphatase PTP1-like [Physcomitrium patens]XP_024369808.1 protein-tyrosine-phosphatase PTP1-like [Physcomitrium patens]PNR56905.1 hypothetical protein PHYPA_003897 [Physcomitrium patens]|eukprot:XP_024369807.1 protein-tyrosine-phosphatase PTP1-like [Physcomitrella patens]